VSSRAAPLGLRGSAHLRLLVAETESLCADVAARAGRLDEVDPAALERLRTSTAERIVTATLALDGARDERTAEGRADAERHGTWLDALGAPGDGDPVELARLRDLEQAGARAALASTDLATAFAGDHADPSGLGMALVTLHGRLTAGLVAPDRTGMLRRGPRVVHDASVGRVLFFPTEAEHLADAWDALLRSTVERAGDPDPVLRRAPVRAALLQLELLRHHPFDAANGRLARAAARLVLRAETGLPPVALDLLDVETELAADPLPLLDEVAASVRRTDATLWVERWLETVVVALLGARGVLDSVLDNSPDGTTITPGTPDLSRAPGGATAADIPSGLADAFTLAEVATALGVAPAQAAVTVSHWVLAGVVRRVPGTGGLRLERR